MIGLKQQKINALELSFDVGRDVAKVGCDGHAHPFSLKDESDRICGVVGNGERTDRNIADLKRLA